jgi:hypothetical protein
MLKKGGWKTSVRHVQCKLWLMVNIWLIFFLPPAYSCIIVINEKIVECKLWANLNWLIFVVGGSCTSEGWRLMS